MWICINIFVFVIVGLIIQNHEKSILFIKVDNYYHG